MCDIIKLPLGRSQKSRAGQDICSHAGWVPPYLYQALPGSSLHSDAEAVFTRALRRQKAVTPQRPQLQHGTRSPPSHSNQQHPPQQETMQGLLGSRRQGAPGAGQEQSGLRLP